MLKPADYNALGTVIKSTEDVRAKIEDLIRLQFVDPSTGEALVPFKDLSNAISFQLINPLSNVSSDLNGLGIWQVQAVVPNVGTQFNTFGQPVFTPT